MVLHCIAWYHDCQYLPMGPMWRLRQVTKGWISVYTGWTSQPLCPPLIGKDKDKSVCSKWTSEPLWPLCWLAIQVWSVTWADICRTDTQDPGFISDHFPFNGRPLPRRPVQLGTPNLIKTSTVKLASSTGTVWSTRISSRDSFILTSRGWGPERVCQKYQIWTMSNIFISANQFENV